MDYGAYKYYNYIKRYVLWCATIRFKQKYGHRSSRRADMNMMNLRCKHGKSVFTAEIGQYWVVGRRSWDCVIWRHFFSYIYIKHHTIEKYLIETSNRRYIFIQLIAQSGKLQTNVGNDIKNILYLWFSHFTSTEAHRCLNYSLSLYFNKKQTNKKKGFSMRPVLTHLPATETVC